MLFYYFISIIHLCLNGYFVLIPVVFLVYQAELKKTNDGRTKLQIPSNKSE